MNIYRLLEKIEGLVFTTSEAAEILDISERAVRQLCIDKKLGAIKFKGSWLIKSDDLHAYQKGTEYVVIQDAFRVPTNFRKGR